MLNKTINSNLLNGGINITIDRIDWHEKFITDDISEDELLERAGAHIGYYLEWAYKKGFAPSNPETHDVAEYQKVSNSEVSGIQFLIENCDTKFWDVDLNEEGLKFTFFAYETYLSNLEAILEHKPYIKKYNQRDLQNVSKYLDKAYADYLTNPSSETIKEKKQSFFQRLKDLFLKNK